MADGLFDQGAAEQFRQATITRERLLVVNTSPTGDLNGGLTYAVASSSYASLNPNDTTQGQAVGMGPHFTMAPQTSDGVHPYGFKLALFTTGLQGTVAVPNGGGFTVTPWVLIGSAQIPNLPPALRQIWASLAPTTGVDLNEWWHSFDVNACAIRFQIGNILTHGALGIAFAEL